MTEDCPDMTFTDYKEYNLYVISTTIETDEYHVKP